MHDRVENDGEGRRTDLKMDTRSENEPWLNEPTHSFSESTSAVRRY